MSLHGHKIAARSPVIATTFQQDKEEGKNGKKNASHLSQPPLGEVLTHLASSTYTSLVIPRVKGNILSSHIN